ncbi:MAG TPA: hypothetical protein VNA20_04760 [Frankiaceae bacterium]|nr:hypothetical protein [Frankiaceae bacterium]
MKRLLVVTVLAAASLGATATPAVACDDPVDAACQEHPCEPGTPCTIDICVVWVKGDCVVG